MEDERIKRQKYLLKNYLGEGDKEKKKRSRKEETTHKSRRTKSTIIDDDMDGFLDYKEQEEDDAPVIVQSKTEVANSFKSKKESGWQTIRGGDSEPENERINNKEKEDIELDENEGKRMTNGARVGLQTGKQVAADIKRQEIMIKKKMMQLNPDEIGRGAETIYRDVKGRKIDVKAEKAKAEAERLEEERMEKARIERNKGIVQQELAQQRKEEYLKNKDKSFSRYADDKELNDELKEREVWNDPAANFLTKKKKKSKYPQYQGRAPPNRYNILPGYRWDGRDRSNGFEKKLFEKINAQKYKLQESHAWSTEDM